MESMKHTIVRFGLILIGVASVCFSQTARKTQEADTDDQAKSKVQSELMLLPPLDAPVNPDKYIVGPSDVFAVVITYSPQLNFKLVVSLEGTLIVPTVGEIDVLDMTLTDMKKRVISEIKKRYLAATPTVTLMKPREVIVNVSGTVKYPGRYVLYATDRIERAIQQANKQIPVEAEKLKLAAEVIEWPSNASRRNIKVRRRKGPEIRVDLQLSSATRDDRWNPYVLEGDEIFVPRIEGSKSMVTVSGAVHQPGAYEYVDGDKLSDIINLAKGLTKSAVPDSIFLFRQDQLSLTLRNSVISLKEILSARRADVALEPGDRIVVREQVDLREDYRVAVEGEVLHPGTYPITRERTRLSEVLQKAGGPTALASLKDAELIRKSVEPKDVELERLIKNRGNIAPEDEGYLAMENELRLQGERVRVDFEKLILAGDSTQDVYLRHDDRIVFPSLRKSVYVFGQVVTPTQVSFIPGKNVDYYVSKAGGYTDRARPGDVMIIKRSTRQWLEPGETQIEDGDYVWVPKEPYRPFSYYLGIVGQTASIISGALTIVLLVLQLQK
jgi:protein involved in polysaccharide export with SLBB domain